MIRGWRRPSSGSEILLSFVDPNAKRFNREFNPDHLPRTKRMLLAKVFSQFAGEDDHVAAFSSRDLRCREAHMCCVISSSLTKWE